MRKKKLLFQASLQIKEKFIVSKISKMLFVFVLLLGASTTLTSCICTGVNCNQMAVVGSQPGTTFYQEQEVSITTETTTVGQPALPAPQEGGGSSLFPIVALLIAGGLAFMWFSRWQRGGGETSWVEKQPEDLY